MIDAERWNGWGWECGNAHPMLASDFYKSFPVYANEKAKAESFHWNWLLTDWLAYHADAGTEAE